MSARNIQNFPYEIRDVEPETTKELTDKFTGLPSGFIYVGRKKYFFNKRYEEEAAQIYNFAVRPDDTFIVTFPRSGTTMTQELVWIIKNDFDLEKAQTLLSGRWKFLEASSLFDHVVGLIPHGANTDTPETRYEQYDKAPSPRFIKSHMPLSLLPPSLLDTCKLVYVARNPLDVAVSYYYHNRLSKIYGYTGNFKDYWNYFVKGQVHFAPFFEVNKEAWQKRNHPNMLFLFYEDFIEDFPATARRISKFFGKHISEEQIRRLGEHMRFDNFKKNDFVNGQEFKDFIEVPNEEDFIRKGLLEGFIEVGPEKYFLPKRYEKEAADIYNFKVRPDDTFVVTFPRSGTTWTQELVWLIKNDLDFARAQEHIQTRFPFLEFKMLTDATFIENKDDPKAVEDFKPKITPIELGKCPSPRFIKSHLPFSLLPPDLLDTCKVVFVARDPLDVAVSYYHHNRLLTSFGFNADFKTYWNYFMKGQVPWAPFFAINKEAWQKRTHPNMLFLFYEDLVKDLPAAIRRVSDFFGKSYSEEQIGKLCEHLHIDNFKKNTFVNGDFFKELKRYNLKAEESFIRSGKPGGWREYFDEEMTAQAQRWIADNLRDTDLRFTAL